MQHHARRKAQEASPPVGLQHDEAIDPEGRISQEELVPHGQAQGFQQRLVHPHRAAGRSCAGGLHRGLGPGLDLQLSAQGIVRAHGLDRHQPRGAPAVVGGPSHAGEPGAGGGLQPQVPGTLSQPGRGGLVAGDHSVAAQQLAGVAGQAGLEPVGKEGHGCERGHGQHHRQGQQAQLAGLEVAPGLKGGQAPQGSRPPGHGRQGSRSSSRCGHGQKVPHARSRMRCGGKPPSCRPVRQIPSPQVPQTSFDRCSPWSRAAQ